MIASRWAPAGSRLSSSWAVGALSKASRPAASLAPAPQRKAFSLASAGGLAAVFGRLPGPVLQCRSAQVLAEGVRRLSLSIASSFVRRSAVMPLAVGGLWRMATSDPVSNLSQG